MKTTDSLKKQSAWLLTAKLIAFGFSFMLPLLLVRFLAQEQVGVYREAFLVITNAVVILPLGFSMSAYYFLARETERRGAAVLNILLFNFAAGGIACFALSVYPQLLGSIFGSDVLTALAPKIGVVVWIWIFSTFLEVVALANQEARLATGFIVFASFSKTLLMSAAVIAFGTVEAFLWAAIIQGSIQTIILLSFLRSRFPRYWREFDLRFFREHSIYAIPYGLAGVLWIAQTDIHNYFVGHKFSPADFAIYAYGCFEVPLLAMLTESVTSVLIPRMSALQLTDDREEMIRLLGRAMQKLAFFFLPAYVFLMITAPTFITTLFTDKYAASVPIFMINLTLLPASIIINDPVVRAYGELGRRFLIVRIFIVAAVVGALCLFLDRLPMTGIIAIAVGALLAEKLIASSMVINKLGFSKRDLHLLWPVLKTACVAILAGAITFLVYSTTAGLLLNAGRHAADVFGAKPAVTSLIGGLFVLGPCGLIFTLVYLAGASMWGVIEESEKSAVLSTLRRFRPGRIRTAVVSQPQS